MENQDRQPTEFVITGVEIPLDDLAWLVTMIVVVAALVSAAVSHSLGSLRAGRRLADSCDLNGTLLRKNVVTSPSPSPLPTT